MAWIKQRLRHFQKVQNETLDIDYLSVPLENLPPILQGFRMAVISDLHIARLGPYHHKILQAVASIKPQCILIPGDTIDEFSFNIDTFAPFFRSLTQLAPTLAVLGNNDCLPGRLDSLREMYRKSGVILLENELRLLPVGDGAIQITGLMDPLAAQYGIEPSRKNAPPDPTYVTLSESAPPKEAQGFQWPSILMIHQPQVAKDFMKLHPSVIVAGHAHGGQFRVPGIGGLYAPGQGIFPRLTSGLYRIGGAWLLVSRGLANHHFPLRLHNRPHLAWL